MKRKKHLNMDGLKKIVSIKSVLNNGLSDQLKEAFPDTITVSRMVQDNPIIPNSN